MKHQTRTKAFPGNFRIRPFGLSFCLLLVVCLRCSVCLSDPQPGDIFREYHFDEGRHLCKKGVQSNSSDFEIAVNDLVGAIKAEITGYFHTGHIGTSERMIQVNRGQKVPVPDPDIPKDNPDCFFRYTFGRPSVEIPLRDLQEGSNTFTFSVGPQTCHGFNWPCWGFHCFVLRIYYEGSKPHPGGRIVTPIAGTAISDDKLQIETEARSAGGSIQSVQVIGYYNGYPFEGSGRYQDWHYMVKERSEWSGFVGQTVHSPHRLSWDMKWLPDQDEPIKLMARITDSNGISYMTSAVEGLQLIRKKRSVKMYKAVDMPENFRSRIGKSMKCLFERVSEDLGQAVEAQLVSIIPIGHLEGKYLSMAGLNNLKIRQYDSLPDTHTDFFYDPYIPIGLGALQSGVNEFFIYSNTNGHMTEVCWPGPAILVAYYRSLPKDRPRPDRPTYAPDSDPYYDTESLRYSASQSVSMVALDRDRVHHLDAKRVGDYMEFALFVPKAGTYRLKVGYLRGQNHGQAQLSIDGKTQQEVWDQYTSAGQNPDPDEAVLGIVKFPGAGTKSVRLSCVGKNPASGGYGLTISYLYLEDTRRPASRPASPTELTAIPIDRSVIQLKWKDNSTDETSFTIEFRIGPGRWVQIDQVASNKNMYVATSVKEGTQHAYRVRAHNARGYSRYSNEVGASGFSYR